MPTFILPLARKGLSVLALSMAGFVATLRSCGERRSGRRSIEPAASLEGNFLSAYIAGSARDTAAATIFFREAIQEDPRNQELLERGFVAFLGNGSMTRPFGRPSALVARSLQQSRAIRPRRPRPEGTPLQTRRAPASRRRPRPQAGSHRHAPDRLGLCRLEGRQAGAFEPSTSSRASGPSTSSANTTPALIADVVGNPAEAEKRFKAAYEGERNTLQVVDAYARFLAKRGRRDEAIGALPDLRRRRCRVIRSSAPRSRPSRPASR